MNHREFWIEKIKRSSKWMRVVAAIFTISIIGDVLTQDWTGILTDATFLGLCICIEVQHQALQDAEDVFQAQEEIIKHYQHRSNWPWN